MRPLSTDETKQIEKNSVEITSLVNQLNSGMKRYFLDIRLWFVHHSLQPSKCTWKQRQEALSSLLGCNPNYQYSTASGIKHAVWGFEIANVQTVIFYSDRIEIHVSEACAPVDITPMLPVLREKLYAPLATNVPIKDKYYEKALPTKEVLAVLRDNDFKIKGKSVMFPSPAPKAGDIIKQPQKEADEFENEYGSQSTQEWWEDRFTRKE